ncbi:MAG TPA: hypothetical protein ENL19_01835 [candidate division WOR-3 bacterium]|uniref:Uncharacterized protein n=1 Tax=candidate division WOR-3 bacterium TaxID=2052148 RepID=A0A7C5H5V8_UNCW3|nr:hypothetical protein [candidate division WOR-3 bacterium]
MGNLNGDAKILFDAISELKVDIATISTRQEERHTENIKKTDVLFKKVEGLKGQVCPAHTAVMKDINRLYTFVWGIILVIVGSAVKAVLAWKR